jgi:hypothetical protein
MSELFLLLATCKPPLTLNIGITVLISVKHKQPAIHHNKYRVLRRILLISCLILGAILFGWSISVVPWFSKLVKVCRRRSWGSRDLLKTNFKTSL